MANSLTTKEQYQLTSCAILASVAELTNMYGSQWVRERKEAIKATLTQPEGFVPEKPGDRALAMVVAKEEKWELSWSWEGKSAEWDGQLVVRKKTQHASQDDALEALQDFEERLEAIDGVNLCLSVSDTFNDGNLVALIQKWQGGSLAETVGESECLYLTAAQLSVFIEKLTKLRDLMKEAGQP